MPAASRPASGRPPAEVREEIVRFLAGCREPAVFEPGDPPILLRDGNCTLEVRAGVLLLEAWDDERNVTRRISSISAAGRGRMELGIERFGRSAGTLLLVDMKRPGTDAALRCSRLGFREQFHRFLTRQFPGWKVAELSTEADLEHTLSPAFPRAFVRRGGSGWAAIGLPPNGDAPAVLTFGLVWLDYLRGRERRVTIEGLALYLPFERRQPACLRLAHLNPRVARYAAFVYGAGGTEDRLDPADYGNLETRLDPCARPPAGPHPFAGIEGVECIRTGGGAASLRVRVLEFARLREGELRFGIDAKRKATAADFDEVERLARELARIRSPGARDPANPLYLRSPELWLESQVRANLSEIDASLLSEPVYGQVPAVAAAERGVIDLLACEAGGRLVVLELKASEDPHLPLQALDYWMRVRWHLDRNEFGPAGYFPGIEIAPAPPRLLLVAPALAFHPSTETVLRYLSPEVEVERIGVTVEWRKALKAVFRIRGARRPA